MEGWASSSIAKGISNFCIVVASVLPLSSQSALAQNSNAQQVVPTLSAQDYAEIYQLYASYGPIFDLINGAQAKESISSIFAPDGRHVCGTCRRSTPYAHYLGIDALTKFSTGELGIDNQNGVTLTVPSKKRGGPNFASHMVANVYLQPVPGGVNSRAYLMYQRLGTEAQVDLQSGGMFYDFVVRTDQGWRFKHKNILSVGFSVPNSLSPTFDQASLVNASGTSGGRK